MATRPGQFDIRIIIVLTSRQRHRIASFTDYLPRSVLGELGNESNTAIPYDLAYMNCGYYLRAALIYMCTLYVHAATIRGWLLFE